MMVIAGTVKNAVNLQVLTNKWQQKKESGNVLSKKEANERANWTQEEWMKHNFEEQLEKNREAGKKTEIANKIMHGDTLTPEEVQYLQKEDPTALQTYKQMKAEKKAYEEKLKKCKTKDEVQRLKTETLSQYVAVLKKIENNPYIPISAKLAKAQEMLAKTRNIQEAERKFMQTAQYAKLPTEAEEAQQRAEENAEKNEQNLEIIEDAAEKAKTEEIPEETAQEKVPEEATEETAPDGKKAEDLQEDEKKRKKATPKDEDPVKEIEDSCQRIFLNARLSEGENVNIAVDSERTVGQKVNVSV